ncbi:M28 family peptidase [Neobacillus novalis]|uniref:M28 family peptidase n=1 Tax=Neobacillus novalis TaxID=220687 RepID=A0AA95SDU3_9BACI|nr:M28 family peptidase [Neobacillus novalis]WHY87478.1 M28 family peptidase [Neobacillus novalis]
MKRFGLKKVFSIAIIIAFLLGTNLMGDATAAGNRIFNDMPHTGNVFADMEKQIDYFKEDGDIRDDITVRSLKMHLSGVNLFQKQGQTDKVLKQMESFKRLLDNQKSNGAISGIAFDVLNTYTQYAIGKINGPFNSDNVMQHIKHLSVDIGPREAGSAAERAGAEYIESVLKSYGYETTIEEAPRSNRTELLLKVLSDNNKIIPLKAVSNAPQTTGDGITGNLYSAGTGQPGDFTSAASGKIALIQNGGITAGDKAKNAMAAGAIGVLIYDNQDRFTLPTVSLGTVRPNIPVGTITKKDGEAFVSQLSKGNVQVQLSIKTLTNQKTVNVIAVKKPKGVENPEIYYVGSHLDSVPFAPGANDNASGTSTLMELARIFKDYNGDKELRFAAFGGEELGFVGSKYHIGNLSQDEVKRTKVQFQMDMTGTAWVPASQLFINTVDGKTNLVTQSTHQAAEKLDINKNLLPVHMLSRSDHVPFHEKGVPSALFIWMEPGTPPGGANIEPYYHSLEDKIEHVSPERIQLTGDVVFKAISDLIGFQKNSSKNEVAPLKKAS